MFYPTRSNRAAYPFEGLTARQLTACALWFCGDGDGPKSQRRIALRMGCSQKNVCKLIRKALRRIRANGYDPVRVTARAA